MKKKTAYLFFHLFRILCFDGFFQYDRANKHKAHFIAYRMTNRSFVEQKKKAIQRGCDRKLNTLCTLWRTQGTSDPISVPK